MAGPDRPPTIFASFGRLVVTSTAIPRIALVTEIAWAPADSTALAIVVISVTLGVSFTTTGLVVLLTT
ncbi:hypothetical protein ES703_70742 [subsurface metagenome]